MFESLNPFNPGTFIDNRTGIQSGITFDSILLLCQARHMGASTSIPNVSWTINGRVVSTSNCTNCFTTFLNISNFAASDAGVYQCIFTDTDATGEVVTSKPMRLNTGLYIVCLFVTCFIINFLLVCNRYFCRILWNTNQYPLFGKYLSYGDLSSSTREASY